MVRCLDEDSGQLDVKKGARWWVSWSADVNCLALSLLDLPVRMFFLHQHSLMLITKQKYVLRNNWKTSV